MLKEFKEFKSNAPFISIYVKFYINQIISSDFHSEQDIFNDKILEKLFYFKDNLFSKVEIIGIITNIKITNYISFYY